jgi:hypothetical protein
MSLHLHKHRYFYEHAERQASLASGGHQSHITEALKEQTSYWSPVQMTVFLPQAKCDP